MLTLTGVGGVGKTRLARRVAAEARRTFPDGVWSVELAPLQNGDLLAQTVGAVLGLEDRPLGPPLDSLVAFVSDKRLLLLLDGCEHVTEACAELADRLLKTAPGVRVLATSRQALGISGEHVLAVPPLSTPDLDAPVSAEALNESEAVRLFMERAKASAADFAITDRNRQTVARLCQWLDGIPLAIELAAVRLRSLSVEQILERLDDRFRLLTGACHIAPPHQQTLRAAVDWSYQLCSSEERLLWQRLSVFPGQFDLDAVENICCHDGAITRESALELVTGLIDKSLLIREHCQRTSARYRLLETIREYGLMLLTDSGEERVLRRQHRDYCERMILESEKARFGPHQLDWFSRLHLDHDNLRAALLFSLTEPGETQHVFQIVATNDDYWGFHGLLGECRHWLGQALEQDHMQTRARVKALRVAGRYALLQGDTDTARSLLHESHSVAVRLGDSEAVARVTTCFGQAALHRGCPSEAIPLLYEALNRCLEMDGLACTRWWTLHFLAHAFGALGETDKAIAACEESLTLIDMFKAETYRPLSLWTIGLQYYRRGDTGRAADFVKECLRTQQSIDDVCLLSVTQSLEVMAWMAASEDRHQHAAQLLGAAYSRWRSLGTLPSQVPPLSASHAACERRVRDALGHEAFTATFQHGATLTSDQALNCALGEKIPDADECQQGRKLSPTLTRREREVADLIAQGMSNKEIAATLVIAQRTAENHVENILTKLGFTSRLQIASWSMNGRC
ncbi:ATP-binding protein [Actinoallomurus acaciae]|uniref:LuxR C-terminal-related transcriptional regulator n=1 Tax=Actinoallomurus acaciae TaxID=502577 RepID=A0ABV5Y925_9ACTN